MDNSCFMYHICLAMNCVCVCVCVWHLIKKSKTIFSCMFKSKAEQLWLSVVTWAYETKGWFKKPKTIWEKVSPYISCRQIWQSPRPLLTVSRHFGQTRDTINRDRSLWAYPASSWTLVLLNLHGQIFPTRIYLDQCSLILAYLGHLFMYAWYRKYTFYI